MKDALRRLARWLAGRLSPGMLEFMYTVVCKPRFLRRPVDAVLGFLIPKTVQIHDILVALNPRDPVVSGGLMLNVYEMYEIEMFRKALRPGMVVVDIGAQIGFYTATAAHGVGATGRVIAFEPDPGNFSFLEQTVRINGFSNVDCYRVALADELRRGRLFLSAQNVADHRLYDSGDSRPSIEVDVWTLDGFMDEQQILHIDFIKMDVQGSEGRVLRGMTRILQSRLPVTLMTEFWPQGLQMCGVTADEVLQLIVHSGFTILEMDPSKQTLTPVDDLELLKSRYPGRKYGNLYCVRS